MAWRIEVDKDVQRSMRKLDKQIAKRIVAKLHEISQLEDPRSMGTVSYTHLTLPTKRIV